MDSRGNTANSLLRNYRLGKTLGHGSFGKVKIAEHVLTGYKVAIKILNRRKMKSTDMEEKVRREIKICRLFVHPHVIRLYEVIETQSDIYVVMEYVKHGELFDYIVEKGRLTEDEARHFFQQIIAGVEYCHRNMVVHRDLKPENLLLDSNRNVKLADFGLSNIMLDGHFLRTSCGSPNYAAPEVVSGKLYAGPEVDIWSCGVILYALLCGSLPFDDENIPNLFKKIKSGMYTLPSHLSHGARDLIPRMLAVDPMKRITINEIRQHPWFGFHLPCYLAITPPKAVEHLKKLDEEIIQEVVRMEFDRGQLIESLQKRIQNDATVAYYLLFDNRAPIFTGYLGGEFQESVEASSSVSYPEADKHGFPHHGILSPQLSRKKQWLIGLQSPAHPREIITQILGALQGLNVRWKKVGLYNMKCILVHTFQDSNDTATNNHINNHYINNVYSANANVSKPQSVVKFEIQVMPTVIFFEYNGEWKIKEDNIFKWDSWSSGKWAVIPLDGEICSLEYLQSEIYKIMNLVGTEKLKLSYLPDVNHCNIRPMYIEDDNDLKGYLYFGCAKERPVLQVEFELNNVSLDVVETDDIVETDCIMSLDLNVTDLDDNHVDNENIDDLYDNYFDRTFVSNIEENNVGSRKNGVEEIDAVHVDMDVNEVIQQTYIDHNAAVHDTEIHVHASNDTYSFTDGSNLFIGQIFASKIEVKKELSKIALNSSFEFESIKSSRNVYSVRCVTKGCSWRIWTSKHEDSTDFVIRTYCNTHTCDLTGMHKRHRQASSYVVCDMLVDNFRGQQNTPQPKSIMTMMRNKGVDITYYKALKGKQLAHDIFRGDPERSFALLPSYLKMVKRMNPGSIIDLVVNENNRFKYLFLSYGACARGYRCMRKVVSIDDTWLKGKYDGTLLVASAQDEDFHQYPLAWAVVDVESIASWSWFLTNLLDIVVDEEELMIISDRHPGIIAAVADVYKNAHYGHCI